MVTYRGIVKKGRLVVEGVGLPDGTELDVSIGRGVIELTDDDMAKVREGDEDFRHGRFISAEESLRRLRAIAAGHDVGELPTGSRTRRGRVAGKPRGRTKSAPRRDR